MVGMEATMNTVTTNMGGGFFHVATTSGIYLGGVRVRDGRATCRPAHGSAMVGQDLVVRDVADGTSLLLALRQSRQP